MDRRDTVWRFADDRTVALAGRAGARLAGAQEPLADAALVLGSRVERGRVRQRVEPGEAEQLLEQLGGAVHHRPEAGPPRLLDQPALEQSPDGRLGGHSANARHLRA